MAREGGNYWQPEQANEKTPATPMETKSHDEAFVPPPADKTPHTPPQRPPEEPAAPPETPSLRQTDEIVSWEASEYLHHEKDFWWYTAFVFVVLALLAVAVLLMRSWSFTALVVVMAIAVVFYTQRPPRTLHYTLSDKGLYMEDELHSFAEYRAFGVVRDGAFYAIRLVPTKRFSPATFIYFADKDGERIVDILGTHLPMQEMKLDLVDIFLRKIRL